MENIILIGILALILCAAGTYVYKAKKRGVKCIGCPAAEACAKKGNVSTCGGNCSSCSGCKGN